MEENSRAETMCVYCPRCGTQLDVGAGYDAVICGCCGLRFAPENPAVRSWEGQPSYAPPRKRRTLLWVLGWIFIFPVPLTILMLRNRSLPPWARYGIIAAGWIVYLLISFRPGGSSRSHPPEPEYRAPAITENVSEPVRPPQEPATPKPAATPAPATAAPEQAEEKETEKPEAPVAEPGVTPSFKETMDSYEAFFDEYIAVMKAVADDSSDFSVLMRYYDMLSRYADISEKLEAIDDESLSSADHDYYVEVMLRIDKKLLEAAEYIQ